MDEATAKNLAESIAAIEAETQRVRECREEIAAIDAEMVEVAAQIAQQKSAAVLKAIDSMRLDTLEVSIGGELAGSDLVTLHNRVSAAAAALREVKKLIEDAAIEHIEATGRDIEHADGKRWYVGATKTFKAIDPEQVFAVVMTAANGDASVFRPGEGGVLAASPWKIGAVRSLLGDEAFAATFREEIESDLKTGAVKKGLKVADDRWSAPR